MAKDSKSQQGRIDQFFSGPGARADHWRFLVDAAKAWSDGSGDRNQIRRPAFRARGDRRISRLSRPAPDGRAAREGCGRTTRRRRCARDTHHAVADDAVVPPACQRLGHPRRMARNAAARPAAVGVRRASRFAPALFRDPDRHRRAGHQLAKPLRRMAQAAPSARRLRLRAGVCRKLRRRLLRRHAQSRSLRPSSSTKALRSNRGMMRRYCGP